MQFLKKHYEKIVLGVVLAGLIGGLVFMLFYIAAEKQAMEEKVSSIINRPAKPLDDLNLTTNLAAAARFQAPFFLDLETASKVFNPFEWVKTPDGRLVKKATSLTQVVVVTNIAPLYLVLSLESVATNELGARYVIGVQKQADKTPSKRVKQQRYVSMGDKPNDTFALVEIKGPAENPDGLVLKLGDSGELVTISRGQPYRRVDGYMADFRYDLEKKLFRAQRIGNVVSFGGASYQVFDITQNDLILSDQSNQKKTSLPFAP
jgi:hypothetical protein